MNFIECFAQAVAKFPTRIMLLKFAVVTNPPDVIGNSIFLLVFPRHFPAADLFAQADCLQDRAVGVATAADVVNFTSPRRFDKFRKRFDQVEAVNVVSNLFAFVSEDAIRTAGYGANHEIGKKSVQFGAGMRGTG